MKKVFVFLAAFLICFKLFASTIVWLLFTGDKRYSIDLKKTIWVSESDGQKIIFSAEDGEGDFSNGIHFSYSPPIYRSGGMSTAPDEPTSMEIFVDGRKINSITLRVVGGQYVVVDKRNIKYYLQRKKKKVLGVF